MSYPNQPYRPMPPQQPQQPPRKSRVGKILGFGCLGVVVAIVLIVVAAVSLSGGGSDDGSGKVDTAATEADDAKKSEGGEKKADKEKEGEEKDKPAEEDKAASGKVVFKVWGDASAGADITYGSDSENLKGSGLPMTKSLPFKDDAMYFMVNAQLQGGGDVYCSVTVDGETKKGHAKGGYNICNVQVSNVGLGWG